MDRINHQNEKDDETGMEHNWWQGISEELNREQHRFVTLDQKLIMGIAGPGSGKTRALVYRAAYLISCGVPPHRLMLVTFTNKASQEMKNRLYQLVGELEGMWAGTFHSIGARILRQHASYFNRDSKFSILDEDDRFSLWKEIIYAYKETLSEEEVNLFVKRKMADRLASQATNSGLSLEEVVEEYHPGLESFIPWLKELHVKYERRKEENNAFDFDDLLVKWLELFENNEQIRKKYQDRFSHVLVDEFQDTNVIQGRLVDWFAQNTSVCVVGDDAQSIYGFRFAEVGNMLRFPERHPGCQVIKLEQNYRSHPEIVDLANRIISHNTSQLHKELFSNKPSGEKPVIAKLADSYREANFVVDRMEALLGKGVPPGEISVLYRSSYLASEVEFELLKRNIPYRTYGGLKFLQKAHIRDVVAWLKVLYNPRDTVAWRRIISMQKGLGASTCDQVLKQINQNSEPVKEIIKGNIKPSRGKEGWLVIVNTLSHLVEEIGDVFQMIRTILREGYYETLVKNYPDSWENRYRAIEQFAFYGKRFNHLSNFLESLSLEEALIWETPGEDMDRDHVTLSTIHSAKGKEWEAVFILALNEGTFPGKMAADLEEERRLFYVAATRARRFLFLLTRESDFRWGAPVVAPPSIFLQELASHFEDELVWE